MNGKEVRKSLGEHAEIFVMFASLKMEDGVKMEELPV
ncbi:hypothetical protein A2U01_0105161, partial [Trifolium medium]|nr:hypothetical protein [Trifolium medium]